MNTDLRRLRHALVIAELGSFSAAAERLHITQSALSRSIQSMEQAIAISLFDRSRSGVRVTVAGQAYLAVAAGLLQHARNLESFGKGLADGSTGQVRIGLGTSVAANLLPTLIRRSAERQPRIALSVEITGLQKLLDGVKEERLEFAVFSEASDFQDQSVTAERLALTRPCMLVRRDHPLARSRHCAGADLDGFPIAAGSLTLEDAQTFYGRQDRLILCDDSRALKALTLESDVIWSTLSYAADPELGVGDLVELKVVGSGRTQRDVWLSLYRLNNRTPSPAGEIAAEIARELISRTAP